MKPYYNAKNKTLFLKRDSHIMPIINREAIKNKKNTLYSVEHSKEYNVYLTAINEEVHTLIQKKNKKTLSEEKQKELDEALSHIEKDNIIMYGNANKKRLGISKIAPFIEHTYRKERLRSSSPQEITNYFRNYESRQEKWENSIFFVNSCPDVKMSWQSALRKTGAKGVHGLNNDYEDFYVVLWYDDIDEDKIVKKWEL